MKQLGKNADMVQQKCEDPTLELCAVGAAFSGRGKDLRPAIHVSREWGINFFLGRAFCQPSLVIIAVSSPVVGRNQSVDDP